jgi:hypothetical protein
MINRTELNNDLDEMLNDWQESFIWKSHSYRCLLSTITDEPFLSLGGEKAQQRFRLVCKKADLTRGIPQQMDLITINSVTYRLKTNPQTDPADPAIEYDCEQEF